MADLGIQSPGGLAEDGAHVSGESGLLMLGVRNDSVASLAGTDGDRAPLQFDSSGRLRVTSSATLNLNISYDAGDVDATTQRVTIATDDANLSTINTNIGNLTRLEDAQHVTGDSGIMSLAVRNNTLSARAASDGDYAPFQVNSSGALYTADTGVASIAAAVYVDDADWSDGVSSHMLTGGLYQSTPQTVTDGDVAPFNITANGALHVSDAGGTLTVDQATATNLKAQVIGAGTAGSADAGVLTIQGVASMTAVAISAASASIASGAVASGAYASGSIASGALASGSISDGADVTQGAKADAKSTATDSTAVSVMQVLKEISYMEQTPASRAVTNGGTFATQATSQATTGDVGPDPFFDSDGDNTAQALKAGAGNLYNLHVINSNVAAAYVQLFDTATGSVQVGTTSPVYVLYIPGSGAVMQDFTPVALSFASAITYACTTTPTGNGDPTVGLTFSATYKLSLTP